MRKRIFLSLFVVGLLAILWAVGLTAFWYYIGIREDEEMHITRVTRIVAEEMEHQQDPYDWLKRVTEGWNSHMRLTWIKPDGTILFESAYHADEMENHLSRQEVQEALAKGEGTSQRNSGTLHRQTTYYAVRLADGSVLRGAIDWSGVRLIVKEILPGILATFLLLLAGCLFQARWLTKYILRPLEVTTEAVESIVRGERVPLVLGIPELDPLLARTREQQEHIAEHILALQRERNTMRHMMDSLQEGVVLLDGEGKIADYNSSVEKIFNLTKDCRGELPAAITPDATWLETLALPAKNQMAILQRNGQVYILHVRPLTGGQENARLAVVRDITSEHLAEQHRKEFTANVTHELNTPLTSIRGFAELLANGMYETEAEAQDFARRMQLESERLLEMIASILRLAKMEEYALDSDGEEVSLRQVTEEVLAMCEARIRQKGLTVAVEGNEGRIWTHRGLAHELVSNVLDNAIKYNREGGGIRVEIREDAEATTFIVEDTGIGIAQSAQPHVFERFYRADTSRSGQIKGTGLGLAIVKRIVRMWHGEVELDSREEEGTRITIRIPRQNK